MDFSCKICNSKDFKKILVINKKPDGETDYGIPEEKYYREIVKCSNCGVFLNKHDLLNESIYNGNYNDSIALGNLKVRFEKIINLPLEKSDNKKRVARIANFLECNNLVLKNTSVLDIGSGTCVFLFEMKKLGLHTYCIDPDLNAINHAVENVKVDQAFHCSINDFETDKKFDIITLNKVLEHLKNPLEFIKKVKTFLKPTGVLYIDLPHSNPVVKNNQIFERSEFFVEHLTIYNREPIEYIARSMNMKIIEINEIIDPSGKFTIFAFLNL